MLWVYSLLISFHFLSRKFLGQDSMPVSALLEAVIIVKLWLMPNQLMCHFIVAGLCSQAFARNPWDASLVGTLDIALPKYPSMPLTDDSTRWHVVFQRTLHSLYIYNSHIIYRLDVSLHHSFKNKSDFSLSLDRIVLCYSDLCWIKVLNGEFII